MTEENASLALVMEESRSLYAVPDDLALQMIQECAKKVAAATTIPAVKRIISQAEAIRAFVSKIEASEKIKRDAERLRLDAEIQLGRITKTIPHGAVGGTYAPGKRPNTKSKRQFLKDNGLSQFRANIAEKLADTPPGVLRTIIEKVKRPSLNKVVKHLGYRNEGAADLETLSSRGARDGCFLPAPRLREGEPSAYTRGD